MASFKVAKKDEVPPGKMKMVKAGDAPVLLVNVEGKLYAIGGLCTHMKGNLSQGTLEGGVVTCPKHGAQFDVTRGTSVRGPKIGFLKLKGKDEPSYSVRLEGDDVIVDL
jgi:3-phenylpropionate/trans-cinnamate dioxygenase ferredoxin subunit